MGKLLQGVTSGIVKQSPFRVVLYGPGGVGKTTWASNAPNPIFCAEHGGTEELDVKRMPFTRTWDEILGGVQELIHDPHDYQTFVLDTADWLEPIIWRSICDRDKKSNIEDYGYGKGYKIAIDEWRYLFSKLEDLQDRRGMHVIILGHREIKTFQNPIGDPYDRFEMKLSKDAKGLLMEWSKAMLFANFETFTRKKSQSDRKAMAFGEGSRVVYTQPRPQWDAKTRYTLPEKLPLSWSEFERAARSRVAAAPEDVRDQIKTLLEDADDVTRTQAAASLERCGGDSGKLVLLRDWLRCKVQPKSETAAE